ncbi:hypothetical protein HDU86_008190 [Geranomyces michiganensis]|nr:hypothetical protein HDU86_008190 [Geranomyces michiganensis]
MWKRKEIAVGASSVVDLKAELFKKQEEYEKEKLRTGSAITRQISSKPIKKPPKNKGVEQRSLRDAEELPTLDSTLEASWVALQRKAKLYDKLAKEGAEGKDNENDDSLVDFLYKTAPEDEAVQAAEADADDGDAWVEAMDEFGRTRIVRTSQVESLGLRFVKGGPEGHDTKPESGDAVPSMLSDDMRREMEREAWEANARQEMASGAQAHFDSRREIRTLGTGFYQFAQDDEERARQMRELDDIRAATLEGREKTAGMKGGKAKRLDERKRLLKERAAAAAAKRRKTAGESALPGAAMGGGDAEAGNEGDDNSSGQPPQELAVEQDDVDDFLKQIVGQGGDSAEQH